MSAPDDFKTKLDRAMARFGLPAAHMVGPASEPPPVDEDAAALGEAYERGLREGFERAIRLGAAHIREIGDEKSDSVVTAAGDWLEEWGQANVGRLATKQGAESS